MSQSIDKFASSLRVFNAPKKVQVTKKSIKQNGAKNESSTLKRPAASTSKVARKPMHPVGIPPKSSQSSAARVTKPPISRTAKVQSSVNKPRTMKTPTANQPSNKDKQTIQTAKKPIQTNKSKPAAVLNRGSAKMSPKASPEVLKPWQVAKKASDSSKSGTGHKPNSSIAESTKRKSSNQRIPSQTRDVVLRKTRSTDSESQPSHTMYNSLPQEKASQETLTAAKVPAVDTEPHTNTFKQEMSCKDTASSGSYMSSYELSMYTNTDIFDLEKLEPLDDTDNFSDQVPIGSKRKFEEENERNSQCVSDDNKSVSPDSFAGLYSSAFMRKLFNMEPLNETNDKQPEKIPTHINQEHAPTLFTNRPHFDNKLDTSPHHSVAGSIQSPSSCSSSNRSSVDTELQRHVKKQRLGRISEESFHTSLSHCSQQDTTTVKSCASQTDRLPVDIDRIVSFINCLNNAPLNTTIEDLIDDGQFNDILIARNPQLSEREVGELTQDAYYDWSLEPNLSNQLESQSQYNNHMHAYFSSQQPFSQSDVFPKYP
ncbi:hypothetical protein G6F57_008417 [Rhizopus arrhizus]|uniref:Uncharacterized protein n=1 Tax=Rhizopus oryzae TaxID=64495 RepID=A0A9P6X4F6_RHIOR|nr:hypothetical protein G6F30_009696 [Rhizopus arrhizus]KAG1403574.1 hypothetical protein G6F58_010344 [Rhizopus delemar]KAG0977698.1 hypothetical protein G6F29_009868 [Rhizopus arrhizus]KAG0990329.1 hypothetical protein G6F28_009346 [Rhizopus arrhizus]KAG1004611.1 hypothetical protein G6F27_009978 [Rhizopus arrhizus]